MLATDELLLTILRGAIRGKKASLEKPLSEADLSALFDRAEEQKVLPLIFDAICPSHLLHSIDSQLIERYQKKALEWVTRQIIQTNEFLVMLHGMQKVGLDPIVMKGLVCRELYPQPMLRTSVDEDLLVEDRQFKAFHEAIVACGLNSDQEAPDFEKDVEISYHHPSSPLYIELHRRMFAPDQEVYGLFSSMFSDVHQRATTIQVQDMHVRTLSPTDHLLFLMLHAYKHFLYGGVGIRQMCDIGLFAEAYGQEVDWEYILHACQQTGMGTLPAAFFHIMATYLGINLTKANVPSEWREQAIDVLPLLNDIMSGGLMGNVDGNRMHSSNITLGAVASKGRDHHSLAGVLQSLFPPFDYMQSLFGYVKRKPLLLPIGWLHRIINYIFRLSKDNRLSAIATIKIGQERIALLKQYGIIQIPYSTFITKPPPGARSS